MHDFNYKDSILHCEEVSVKKIAEQMGTPLYIYSRNTLENHFRVFDGAFSSIPHLTCYSVKANSNIAILRLFSRMGAGVDVVSGGEIFRAVEAGVDPEKIVYSGVGKTAEEISYALDTGILMFNVESVQELELLQQTAVRKAKTARVALRINPDIDPRTHPYISTGLKKNKFGISISEAFSQYQKAKQMHGIEVVGVACHIGSQITELSPFVDALEKVKAFASALLAEGFTIKYVDIGGGLGISYNSETPPHPDDYAEAVIRQITAQPYSLILEPGRVIAGNAGILVSKVLYHKKGEEKNFLVVDAAMNDLVRPSLYKAYHEIKAVSLRQGEMRADVVGPICETGDFLAQDRTIPYVIQDDYIALMSAGAYGFSMSSNYNSRPRAAEVLVCGSDCHIIRQRETFEDLIRLEQIPETVA